MWQLCEAEKEEKVSEKTVQTLRSVKKEGEEVFQVPEQRFP